jgi:formylglycine-generating enzyme required for sulfatase activity
VDSLDHPASLFSLKVNDNILYSSDMKPFGENSFFDPKTGLVAAIIENPSDKAGNWILLLENNSEKSLKIENLLPLGPSENRTYITGFGPPGLTRATLFLPTKGPIGLIVPDNTWEMGYSSLQLSENEGFYLFARRDSWENADRRRYSTLLHPGGSVKYQLYMDFYEGNWREGLKTLFHERWLYDLNAFDNTLYEREDLKWIREDYLAILQFAWDEDFIENGNSYNAFRRFFHRYDLLHGGYDIYAIWQGWPRLGLDPRNQWDLFRDLPGGTDSIRALSEYCKANNSAFFISYNPWDESTRNQDHLGEMKKIIQETKADGVVLDTRGSSSHGLQAAADSAREGVIMYSEGMAVAKDMPGIISGRVHNAIHMSPPLNLNRLIKPEFQIFRVLDLRDGRLKRELAVSFFNGYGVELNIFSPANPWWLEEEYQLMGKYLMILRQNSKTFHDPDWVPLVNSKDSIWINEWNHGKKKLYTILSLKTEGHSGKIKKIKDETLHWLSLWDHEEIIPERTDSGIFLNYYIDPFSSRYIGTRMEGETQCIAGFPNNIKWNFSTDHLNISISDGDRIVVWKGNPSYQNDNKIEVLTGADRSMRVKLEKLVHNPEGKIVVQAFFDNELLDERVIHTKFATPLRISEPKETPLKNTPPMGMVEIEGGMFSFFRGNDADFIPYPNNFDTLEIPVKDYFMDRYPVTNRQFKEFIISTGYQPVNPKNFLKHWDESEYADTLTDHPVVWVSIDDARAYCLWKGYRLPTEIEWQYAAQGNTGWLWPWGNDFDSTLCNNNMEHTTPVDIYPEGKSIFGVEDLVGNIWQLSDDEYYNGSFYFSIIRGGSFFYPNSSWWYIQGGPQSNDKTQMLLRTSPGFDRSETVGFRCVCDKDE